MGCGLMTSYFRFLCPGGSRSGKGLLKRKCFTFLTFFFKILIFAVIFILHQIDVFPEALKF